MAPPREADREGSPAMSHPNNSATSWVVVPRSSSTPAIRLGRNVSQDRIAYVVTRPHELYYKPLLEAVDPARVFEQPVNRGMGVTILLSILKIMQFDPSPVVGLIPSYHSFSVDAALSN